MNPVLLNPMVITILKEYRPIIRMMVRRLAMFTKDTLTINTECGSVTIKFKQYGINTKST